MNHRGHPIRGAIAGLFLGLFVSLDLVIFGVLALDADLLALFPLFGLLAGVALGFMAPVHRRTPGAEFKGQRADPPPAEVQPPEVQPAERAPAMATPEADPSTV